MDPDYKQCLKMGWGPGTRLEGEAWIGDSVCVIELKYVGPHVIVAQELSRCGEPVERKEAKWTLQDRDWYVVGSECVNVNCRDGWISHQGIRAPCKRCNLGGVRPDPSRTGMQLVEDAAEAVFDLRTCPCGVESGCGLALAHRTLERAISSVRRTT